VPDRDRRIADHRGLAEGQKALMAPSMRRTLPFGIILWVNA